MSRARFFGFCLLLTMVLSSAGALAQGYRLPLGGDGHSCGGGNCIPMAYKDHGGQTDWSCGKNTYTNHGGTDLAPIHAFGDCVQTFPVIAAAAGVVVAVHEGEIDHCDCDAVGCASGYGNYVMIQHADGKVTMYGHLAKGSVAVSENQSVACGAILGRVGQSGNTTGPHLHFEVRVNGAASDPFVGACSQPPSYWVDQGSYNGLPSETCDGGAPSGPFCGDGSCSEDCSTCETDCGACGPSCGDGACDFGETCSSCDLDCGACGGPVCGDGSCSFGESCGTCAGDCGNCELCGDGTCNGAEDCVLCAPDCGSCASFCGDGMCNGGESCGSCPNDCGACPAWCGDGACNGGESCSSCANDCGACACSVSNHLGAGEYGEPCFEAPETWHCVWIPSLGSWGSQVCRDGIWQTFNLNPSSCVDCCGWYSSACAA